MAAAPCNAHTHTVPWSECSQGVPLAPFNIVVVCCAAAAAVIAFTWTENTGSSSSSSSRQGGQLMKAVNCPATSMQRLQHVTLIQVRSITSNPDLWKLGLVQSLFEGSMYVRFSAACTI